MLKSLQGIRRGDMSSSQLLSAVEVEADSVWTQWICFSLRLPGLSSFHHLPAFLFIGATLHGDDLTTEDVSDPTLVHALPSRKQEKRERDWMTPRLTDIAFDREVVVCWLLNVPATCKCISGTDLLRQFFVLPH